MIKTMKFKDVNRKAFDELANLCACNPSGDDRFFSYVTVYYNGSNLKGDLQVDIRPGERLVYEEFMKQLVEILLKY